MWQEMVRVLESQQPQLVVLQQLVLLKLKDIALCRVSACLEWFSGEHIAVKIKAVYQRANKMNWSYLLKFHSENKFRL